jgi:drug/metabolite transporter (DMT)-like permease
MGTELEPKEHRMVQGFGPIARRYLPVATLIALALIWGYSWVPFKIGVVHSSPFVFATLRIIPGSLLMLGLMVVLGKPLKPKAVGLTMLLGLLQTSGFLGFSMMALVSGGAGRTSILANTWQFWVLLMAWPILGERLRGSQWLSVLLGLSGLVLIIAPWHLRGVASALYTLGGAVSWAGSSIVAKVLRKRHTVDLLSLTTWQMLFGAVPLLLLALVFTGDLPDWSAAFDLSLAFTLLVTTCLGSFMWLYALRELPAGIAGLGTLGTPVFGILFSWAQLGERPTALEGAGMVIILVGMAILFVCSINASNHREPAQPGAVELAAAQPRVSD